MSFSAKSVFATLPRTERGRPLVLGGDPKGKNFLYCNGNSIIIRDIENPAICDIYTEHSTQTIVAKYAPSGFYIASADKSGKVRIWDTTQKEHLLKFECQPFAGAIMDLAWSPDSKRIVVGGQGRETFAQVFMWDSGNTLGDMIGHSKGINSVDYRSTRPFRIVTASEDNCVNFYEGPPFKFKHSLEAHTNFAQCVRFSPGGEIFVSGGSDGKMFVYDGKTSEPKGELGSPSHKGGVYGLCFSPDGRQLLSVSGDKTAKIWDVATSSVVTEFVMGSSINDMQVGCLWQGQNLLTISLSGYINYLDVNNPSRPLRILKGHNKPVTAMAVSEDRSTIFTGSSDAHINYWDASTGLNDEMKGKGHSNQVQDMAVDGDCLVTIGLDDTVRFSSCTDKEYGPQQVKCASQPRAVASRNQTTVVACINHVLAFEGGNPTFSQQVKFEPMSVDIHPGQTEVAVGGEDGTLHIYELSNGTLSEIKVIDKDAKRLGKITDTKYSPDGAFLAAVTSERCIQVYTLPGYESLMQATSHSARINSISWTPDSSHFATGSLDCHLALGKPMAKTQDFIKIKAHPQNPINRVEFLDNNTLASVAQDSHVKLWNVTY